MNRKSGLLLAGIFTALVTTGILTVGGFVNQAFGANNSESVVAAAAAAPVADIAVAADTAETMTAAFAEREQLLQAELEKGQTAIRALDSSAEAKLKALDEQLAAMETDAQTRMANIQAVQGQIGEFQGLVQQDNLSFQQELAGLQATDAQLRQQLDATLAELQTAYDEIAARQVADAASSSGGGGSQQWEENNDDDHEEREHEREENDEHDDHEEHEDHDDD